MIHTYAYRAKSTGIARALSGYQSSGLTRHYYFDDFAYIPDLDKCDIAIFGNCLPQDLKRVKHPFKCYLFCSPFGQADLCDNHFPSSQIGILYTAISDPDIKCLVTTNKIVQMIHGGIYAPDSVNVDEKYIPTVEKAERHHIGFLGNNLRKHRNLHNQLVAISDFQKRINPYPCKAIINTDHPSYQFARRFYGFDYIVEDMDDQRYFESIQYQFISFQASYSETFNYMAMEYALRGVPTVGCPDIGEWYPDQSCIVRNVDNPYEISRIAQTVFNGNPRYSQAYWDRCQNIQSGAIEVNKKRKETMHNALRNLEKL